MIDGHTHLENGDLTKEYVHQFIEVACQKGIDHLHILDHTHRFYEFRELYDEVCNFDYRQKQWVDKKQKNSIYEYYDLIEEIKREKLPIKVSFGLEVCFSPYHISFLKNKLNEFPYDFLVGAIHSIDGSIYDLHDLSKEILWNKVPVDTIYKRYYQLLIEAIDSKLFTQIAHPDVIKMYEIYPSYDLTSTYEKIGQHAFQAHVALEDNTGASYRYHHPEIGLNPKFREILINQNVKIIPCSDAHYPEDIGKNFERII